MPQEVIEGRYKLGGSLKVLPLGASPSLPPPTILTRALCVEADDVLRADTNPNSIQLCSDF